MESLGLEDYEFFIGISDGYSWEELGGFHERAAVWKTPAEYLLDFEGHGQTNPERSHGVPYGEQRGL